jgi:hypothetical protein
MIRFFLFLFLLVGFFILPWWIPFLLAVAFLFFCDSFNWIVVIGLLIDVVYSGADHKWLSIPFFFTMLSLFLIWASDKLKKNMLIYNY